MATHTEQVDTMTAQLISAKDGHQIEVFTWSHPDPKACIHILHGMSEHAQRYTDFALHLVAQGFSVIAHNHRGHGASPTTTQGLYGKQNGWQAVLDDIDTVRTCVPSNRPYIMYGHSMGSFITQSYLSHQPNSIDGLMLSGSNILPGALTRMASVLASVEKWRKGAVNSSGLLQNLAFGSFNRAFKPTKTDFDWLSRDTVQVQKYINDPLCGFDCTTQLWLDMFTALTGLYGKKGYQCIQKNLPILLFSGDKDPVGDMGKGVRKLANAYTRSGQTNVTCTLYQDGRHEMLNETNRQRVYADVVDWLNQQI